MLKPKIQENNVKFAKEVEEILQRAQELGEEFENDFEGIWKYKGTRILDIYELHVKEVILGKCAYFYFNTEDHEFSFEFIQTVNDDVCIDVKQMI